MHNDFVGREYSWMQSLRVHFKNNDHLAQGDTAAASSCIVSHYSSELESAPVHVVFGFSLSTRFLLRFSGRIRTLWLIIGDDVQGCLARVQDDVLVVLAVCVFVQVAS